MLTLKDFKGKSKKISLDQDSVGSITSYDTGPKRTAVGFAIAKPSEAFKPFLVCQRLNLWCL